MKSKVCFSSVCTGDSYSYYIPLFVYTVKRAYPDAGVKVFVTGKLNDDIHEALKLIPYDGWEVKEDCFKSYPNKSHMTNCLRFLVDEKEYKGYSYVFVKDIDFLIFSHKTSHYQYFKKQIGKLPYFGARGPHRRPRRYNINGSGWKCKYTRVAGGSFSFKNPAWFEKTKKAQKEYRHSFKHNLHDRYDSHKPASYREYDEVMLYRIIKLSGLKVPTRKNKNALGKRAPKKYRDMHLGDFNKKKHNKKRVSKRITIENVRNFAKLERDPVWIEIRKRMRTSSRVRESLRRARKYVKKRLNLSSLSGEGTVKKRLKKPSDQFADKPTPTGKQ